jgi:opacity protein-like surface antigen
MIRSAVAAAVLVSMASGLAAQSSARPDGWQVRYDRSTATDSSMKIETMAPGWHFTTNMRGSGIAWQPNQNARGSFRVEAETFLFPTTSGHAEGYGLVLGGRNLNEASQEYLYFLVRGDGQYLIKHRAGAQTHDIVPWTPHAAIARQEGTANAREILAVEAAADSVRFFVNGQRVHTLARAAAPVDGQVGMRVNHALSVHVTRVTVTPR